MAIRAGIFDLDGTLYFSDPFGREIARVASRYIADLKGCDPVSAWETVRQTKRRLTAEQGVEASLSTACMALGGDLRDLHARFSAEIDPVPFLTRDERAIALLESLAAVFPLVIYTNNNLPLTLRIMDTIGVRHIFTTIHTIEDFWVPKPDRSALSAIIGGTGCEPSECLFAGDRYDIDLRLPESMGAEVHLVRSVEDLMALGRYATTGGG